jgi:hypothetical protein
MQRNGSTSAKDNDMKTTRLYLVAAVLVASLASAADAQVFYAYPGAPPTRPDHPAAGADIGFGDELFRLLGYGRFNVNSVSDLGIELLFDNTDTRIENDAWRWGFGVDYKYAIVPKDSTRMPFDLAVNAGFGYQSGGDMWNIRFPVGGVVSRPLRVAGDNALVPYGGVYILFQYAKWDLPPGVPGDDDNYETEVELRAGAGYQINRTSTACATLYLGAGTKFYLGVNFLL